MLNLNLVRTELLLSNKRVFFSFAAMLIILLSSPTEVSGQTQSTDSDQRLRDLYGQLVDAFIQLTQSGPASVNFSFSQLNQAPYASNTLYMNGGYVAVESDFTDSESPIYLSNQGATLDLAAQRQALIDSFANSVNLLRQSSLLVDSSVNIGVIDTGVSQDTNLTSATNINCVPYSPGYDNFIGLDADEPFITPRLRIAINCYDGSYFVLDLTRRQDGRGGVAWLSSGITGNAGYPRDYFGPYNIDMFNRFYAYMQDGLENIDYSQMLLPEFTTFIEAAENVATELQDQAEG